MILSHTPMVWYSKQNRGAKLSSVVTALLYTLWTMLLEDMNYIYQHLQEEPGYFWNLF